MSFLRHMSLLLSVNGSLVLSDVRTGHTVKHYHKLLLYFTSI